MSACLPTDRSPLTPGCSIFSNCLILCSAFTQELPRFLQLSFCGNCSFTRCVSVFTIHLRMTSRTVQSCLAHIQYDVRLLASGTALRLLTSEIYTSDTCFASISFCLAVVITETLRFPLWTEAVAAFPRELSPRRSPCISVRQTHLTHLNGEIPVCYHINTQERE